MVSLSSGRGTFFVFIMFLFELLISTSNVLIEVSINLLEVRSRKPTCCYC